MTKEKAPNEDRVIFVANGAELTKARLKKGMAMSAVAAALGVNKAKISRWERQALIPSDAHLRALVDLYGTCDFVVLNSRAVLDEEQAQWFREKIGDRFLSVSLDRKMYIPKYDVEKMRKVLGDRPFFRYRLNGGTKIASKKMEELWREYASFRDRSGDNVD